MTAFFDLVRQYAGLRDTAPTGRLRLRDLPAALTSLGSPTATAAGKGGALRGDAGKENSSPPEPALTDEEWSSVLTAVSRADEKPQLDVNFELFLRVYAEMQLRLKGGKKARERDGGQGIKRSSSSSAAFLTASTTTLLHTISESEKASYVGHINAYLAEDPFLKNALPVDPATDQLFHLTKDGVLLWCAPHHSDLCFRSTVFFALIWFQSFSAVWSSKLINLAVPGTIDERAINTKRLLNLWEKNENHTLCLNSAKAIGCTVVNIGTQDLAEGRVGFSLFLFFLLFCVIIALHIYNNMIFRVKVTFSVRSFYLGTWFIRMLLRTHWS